MPVQFPRRVLFFIFLCCTTAASEAKHFEWTPLLEKAYRQALTLRFEDAQHTLETVRREDPDNLILLHVENYLDFFKVYISEDEAIFDKLEKNKNDRIQAISREGDPSSPYYLFLQADIRLQWALARLKFEQFTTAFFETNKAFKLLKKNDEAFPGFMPNKKNLGILHAMAGTIPDNYKWLVDWFTSFEGTIAQGRGELEEVLAYAEENDFIYEQEIYVYYAYLMLHLGNESEEAWQVIKQADLDPSDNPMACFVMANIAMRADRGDEAIDILLNRPKGPAFYPFHYLDYMTGLAKLQRLDPDADVYLRRFVKNFRGRNFIKDAYQKMAWHSLLQSDLQGYHSNMELCRTRGYTIVGSDKSAYNESLSSDVPTLELLKARLLFDGGRFRQAYDLLKAKQASDYFSEKNRLEYTYRMGRITHKLNYYTQALDYYQQTIDSGADEPWYYACRAALEKGHIYEGQGKKKEAIDAFEQCQRMDPDDHKTGLHQQAKAGVRRLEK